MIWHTEEELRQEKEKLYEAIGYSEHAQVSIYPEKVTTTGHYLEINTLEIQINSTCTCRCGSLGATYMYIVCIHVHVQCMC